MMRLFSSRSKSKIKLWACITISILLVHSIYKNYQKQSKKFILFEFSNSANSDTRIVFGSSDAGLGYANRLYNALTVLTIACITNRQCLISIDGFENYIDLPTVNDGSDFSNVIDTAYDISTMPKQPWLYDKNVDLLLSTTIDDRHMYLKYTNYTASFFEICSNPMYYQKLIQHGLVDNSTIRNALVSAKNTNLQNLEGLLRIGFEVGGNLLKNVWRLKPNMLARVTKFVNEHFGENSFVIGIHIRSEYVDEADIDKFTNCANEIEKELGSQKKENQVKWFITSDIDSVFDTIANNHKNKSILKTNGTARHVGYFKPLLAYKKTEGIEKALIDLELLSHCNEIIATAGSTFSFLASMKSQNLPFYVNGKRKDLENCKRMSLSQPSTTPAKYAVF